MSALAFDPWATLKCEAEDCTSPKPSNPPNPGGMAGMCLGELGGLGRGASPHEKSRSSLAPIPRPSASETVGASVTGMVEQMAEAMMANPIYRITNRATALTYFRANALTRLTARRRE